MTDAAHGLRIKYGLTHNPTDGEVRLWAQRTRQFANQGLPLEQAGMQAAQQVFRDFRTMVFKSEADTIEALLRAAEARG